MSDATGPGAFKPPKFDHALGLLEDRACRAVLRAGGLTSVHVSRASGLDAAARLTFRLLMEYADFPVVPAVSAEPLDDFLVLATKFPRSRLHKAWVAAWDARPAARPGARHLVVGSSAMGIAVAHDAGAPPQRPHLCVGHAAGTIIYVEPLPAWCAGVGWDRG